MRTNLSLAFAKLRKQGYFAKQNFMCCQSCGWAELSDEQAEKAVFYHNQDYRDFRNGGDIYLSWSGNGYEIKSTLESFGLRVDWDGESSKRIVIDGSSLI